MTSNELIQRYLLGLATEEEVRQLETRLASDEQLQDGHLPESGSGPYQVVRKSLLASAVYFHRSLLLCSDQFPP